MTVDAAFAAGAVTVSEATERPVVIFSEGGIFAL